MKNVSFRLYDFVFTGVLLVYAGLIFVSISGLLIGLVSTLIVQNPTQQFRNEAAAILLSIATLPISCGIAIAGAWRLNSSKSYLLSWLPLLLPLVSVAIIYLVTAR